MAQNRVSTMKTEYVGDSSAWPRIPKSVQGYTNRRIRLATIVRRIAGRINDRVRDYSYPIVCNVHPNTEGIVRCLAMPPDRREWSAWPKATIPATRYQKPPYPVNGFGDRFTGPIVKHPRTSKPDSKDSARFSLACPSYGDSVWSQRFDSYIRPNESQNRALPFWVYNMLQRLAGSAARKLARKQASTPITEYAHTTESGVKIRTSQVWGGLIRQDTADIAGLAFSIVECFYHNIVNGWIRPVKPTFSILRNRLRWESIGSMSVLQVCYLVLRLARAEHSAMIRGGRSRPARVKCPKIAYTAVRVLSYSGMILTQYRALSETYIRGKNKGKRRKSSVLIRPVVRSWQRSYDDSSNPYLCVANKESLEPYAALLRRRNRRPSEWARAIRSAIKLHESIESN